jgi:predicted transcriptional regulator
VTDREAARQRTALLKRLRGEHAESLARTPELLKEQQAFRKRLRQAMKEGAKTIPEIAAASGLPSERVLWHVAAMKKYDLVREVGKQENYYQYELAEEAEP